MVDHADFAVEAGIPDHPDGRPWKKACRHCALKPGNPQNLTDEEWNALTIEMAFLDYTFYCEHRSDDGKLRQCACHAAIERGKEIRGE